MNIVHLNSNDIGGAANAAIRLHNALIEQGLRSFIITKYGHSRTLPDHYFYLHNRSWKHIIDFVLEEYLLKNIFPPRNGYSEDTVLFTSPHSLLHPEQHQKLLSADIIHLHWISQFVDYGSFFKRINKPVVLTLHDMNPFTGGCHYSGTCTGYQSHCDACPQLKNTHQPEAARIYLEYKMASIALFPQLYVIAPTNWVLNQSIQSNLFMDRPHYLIPNGIDTSIFTLLDPVQCKQKLKIQPTGLNILFVSHSLKNKTKGLALFLDAMQICKEEFPSIHITIVGKGLGQTKMMGHSYTYFPFITDESKMAEIYNAADLYISPSSRDNLPNTLLESICCGCPVLVFRVGGICEIIEDGFNGLYANDMTVMSMVEAFRKFLLRKHAFDRKQIHLKAKQKYDTRLVAEKHAELYQSILQHTTT
ncbi:MAG: glycosyltransferase [Saprospiraceae bacterium]